MQIVDTEKKLQSLVELALKSSVVFIDTEFIREKTYYPQLCLVQMQIKEKSFVLDPFCFDSIKPLSSVLGDKNVLKVFHAAAQDLEILFYETGVVPHPIFDTQLAASLTFGTNQPGLSNLLKSILHVNIDKSEGFTDWSRRPLTEKQMKYAVEDVLYLPHLYDELLKKLKQMGREKWLDDEFLNMCKKNQFIIDPKTRFEHLKHVTKLKPRELALARELAAWREIVAQKRNIPRKWVLNDEQVCEICKRDPKTIDSLFAVRGAQSALSLSDAREVLSTLAKGRRCEKKNYPKLDVSSPHEESVGDVVFLMNALVKLRATENHIAQSLIANNHDLTQLARGHKKNSKLLKGWRKEVVGKELLDLLNGKIGLTCKNMHLHIQQTD